MNLYIYLLLLSALYQKYNIEQNMFSLWEELTPQVDKWLQFNAVNLNKRAHVIIYNPIRFFHQFVI